MSKIVVTVGSTNLIKIKAVRQAFTKIYPNQYLQVNQNDVESGVSRQPRCDKEAIEGACNRAYAAFSLTRSADFSIGLEGSLTRVNAQDFDTVWVAVIDPQGLINLASSLRMPVSPKMVELIDQGYEMGQVCDMLFHVVDSKQKGASFGLMTNGAISRVSVMTEAVSAAMNRWIYPEYWQATTSKDQRRQGGGVE